MNNKPNLMFHEVLDNQSENSGWHISSKGKYTISKNKFRSLINTFQDTVNYTFDDGGISNLYASNELLKNNIKGIFFIATSYINKSGFLSLEQLNYMSKNHYIYAHGHKHLMKTFNSSELKNDWESSLSFMTKHGFSRETICLPGGTFSKTHYNILLNLGVKNIYHSASSNSIINVLYGHKMNFIPRFIVDKNFTKFQKFNFSGFKSLTKQLLNFKK